MNKEIEAIQKLAKMNVWIFHEDELEHLGIFSSEKDILLQNNLLRRTNSVPNVESPKVYSLTEIAHSIVLAKETLISTEQTRKLTETMLLFTKFLIGLTIIQIILALYFKFF